MRQRPSPEVVSEILRALKCQGDVFRPMLVAAIQRETGCSRASAYRAVTDAIQAGTIGFEESDSETETQ